MCNQAVSLVAAEMERQGIATVCVQLLKSVARSVKPPRALWVPFPHGYPLDQPNAPNRQKAVIQAALAMLEDPSVKPGTLRDFRPSAATNAPDPEE